jgi:peptide/nickel transport system substrate-binding protein
VAALLVEACSPGARRAKSEGTRDSGTLIVGRAADAIGLDPARVTDSESVEICTQIYESLLRYTPGTNDVEAGLAKSWTVSDDGRHWDFQLRRGVSFHDGTPLNAAAVVFSFKRQLDDTHPYHHPDSSGLAFAWGATFKNIVSVEATGEFSLRITIERKFAPFEANLAMFPVSIVSPTAVKKWDQEFYRHPVGTGPFSFVEWTEGRIVVERNENYWGPKAKLQVLVFKAIDEARQRLIALESRAVDVAYSILPEEQQFVSLHPQLKLYRASENNVAYLAINTQSRLFQDVRVRRALNYGINKESIVKLAYQGTAIPAEGALPPTQWGHTPKSFDYPFNPDKARELLDEATAAGAFEATAEINFYVPTTPRPYLTNPVMVGQIIKSDLEALGLTINVIEQDFPGHLAAIRSGEHDLSLIGWVGDNGDPDNFLYVLFDEDNAEVGTARNLAFLHDRPLHELLVAAQKGDGREQRSAIYERAQKRIGELAPWVPLAHSQVSVVARSEVKGIEISPSAHILYEKVERE